MKKLNKNHFIGVLIICMLASILLPIQAYSNVSDFSIKTIFVYCLAQALMMAGYTLFFFCCFLVMRQAARWLDSDAVTTIIRSAVLKYNERRRLKNFNYIYPWLRNFLFTVMKSNNEYLGLPIGKDDSCLTPFSQAYVYRKGCIFYRFQLILPDILDLTAEDLRCLLQKFILSELRNHGIPGLYSVYTGKSFETCDSVYVDHVWIDNDNKLLTFDVLYVASDTSAFYLQKALQRDDAGQAPVQDFYDDQILR